MSLVFFKAKGSKRDITFNSHFSGKRELVGRKPGYGNTKRWKGMIHGMSDRMDASDSFFFSIMMEAMSPAKKKKKKTNRRFR
jgi:hypothetical protein